MRVRKSFKVGDVSPEDTELREATGKGKERREDRGMGGKGWTPQRASLSLLQDSI